MRTIFLALMLLLTGPVAQAQFTQNSPIQFGPEFYKNPTNGVVGLAVPNVIAMGGDPTGASDSTAALNACLAASGTTGMPCVIGGKVGSPSVRIKLAGDVSIPKGATLDCAWSFADPGAANTALYGSLPAITHDSAHVIQAMGNGAAIKNCLIYRTGMTFPAANSSAYAGIGVQDNGNIGMEVRNTVIIGFDTALLNTGPRPVVDHVFADGNGVTHGVIANENGNTDSGYYTNIKIQSLGTLNDTCASVLRPGSGLNFYGINFIDNIVSQNFQVAQFNIRSFVVAGKIWADYPSQINGCNTGSSVGVLVNTGGMLDADQVTVAGTIIGAKFINGAVVAMSRIDKFFGVAIVGDCIQVGAPGVSGGYVRINDLTLNPPRPGCGGHIVSMLDDTSQSSIHITDGQMANQGGAVPFFAGNGHAYANQLVWGPNIITDASPVSALAGPVTVNTCTGIGGAANCVLTATSRTSPWSGSIQLSPDASGSGPATSGSVALHWPLSLINSNGCTATLEQSSIAWPAPAGVQIQSYSPTETHLNWSSNSALVAGQTYRINFNCSPL